MPLLIVTGEFDFPFVRRGAAFLYEQVTGARLPRLDEPGQWQNSHRVESGLSFCRGPTIPKPCSRRALETRSGAGSLRVSPEITKASFSPGAFWARAQLRVLLCLLSLLIWFPLIALLADLLMPARMEHSSNSFVSPIKGSFGVSLDIRLRRRAGNSVFDAGQPVGRLRLLGGDYLTGLLCATGMVGLAALRPDWKSA